MRWQLTIMTIKLPGAPPARTPINARYETRPAAHPGLGQLTVRGREIPTELAGGLSNAEIVLGTITHSLICRFGTVLQSWPGTS
jgi:hypothetical protein